MAMRGRGRGTNPSGTPRLIVGLVYEQFKPMSEWRQEDDYDTLLVYLPGKYSSTSILFSRVNIDLNQLTFI